jgi:hypothetical protein
VRANGLLATSILVSNSPKTAKISEAENFRFRILQRLLLHIGNRKCIKFVIHRNLLKMQRSIFLSRNLNGRYLLNIKIQSFFPGRQIVTKLVLYLLYGEISKTKLKFYSFLVEICMGDTLKMTNFKILNLFSGSWTLH